MKKLFAVIAIATFMTACGSGSTPATTVDSTKKDTVKAAVDTTQKAADTTKAAVDTTKK
ncbi:MAG: hypothetical protein KGL19_13315 [Bacteroidota bacterium]|nr:hypothetical protein [Bacteroidota bacterium]